VYGYFMGLRLLGLCWGLEMVSMTLQLCASCTVHVQGEGVFIVDLSRKPSQHGCPPYFTLRTLFPSVRHLQRCQLRG
jgi:hypothetical protein